MSCVCLWWCDNKGACAKNFVRILGKWPYTRVFSCVYRLSYVFLYGVYIEIGSYIFLLFCLHFFFMFHFPNFPSWVLIRMCICVAISFGYHEGDSLWLSCYTAFRYTRTRVCVWNAANIFLFIDIPIIIVKKSVS